ncbi:DUF6350 family protein [Microbacterium amylolyticum]|uniref:Integral membrane protein n=1 Tax=Microbacterium amylolyticum TaxID=936337 RepID=A0ABS4ZLU8_9MICO|nr:DUF6350 family protein [Microbacterium amylolyticum]MBP2437431.1 hypothetical protein [Microbacterium amylolyticum]
MQRVLIAGLAAVDALIAAAAGIAVVLAPLTLLWITSFSDAGAWGALWPTTARIWQLGNLVPLHVSFDEITAASLGVADGGSSFAVTLAPLAFAAFALLFAARSGRRAVEAGGTLVGVVSGIAAMAMIASVVQLSSDNAIVDATTWQAILFPVSIYATGMVGGAIVAAWSAGDGGVIDLIHDRLDAFGPAWREVPALVVRGAATVIVGMIGVAGVGFAALVAFRGSEMIALYERAGVDVVGATGLTLGQAAYVPTFLSWVLSWVAGPGFAFGSGTAVSPAGTSLGVVPGIPVFGLVPDSGSQWWLLIVLVPIALGALAGWIARRSYSDDWAHDGEGRERYAPRIVITVGIAVVAGAAAALIAAVSRGAIGPGRMEHIGPDPGALALALGLEVVLGAAILLLTPMKRATSDDDGEPLTRGKRGSEPRLD